MHILEHLRTVNRHRHLVRKYCFRLGLYWDGTPFIGGCKMPVKYVAEMFCDRIAACRVYQKEKYTDASPYDYFQHSKGHLCRSEHGHGFIHPETSELLTRWLLLLKEQGEDAAFRQIRQELKELRRS